MAAKKKSAQAPTSLSIEWSLAELPSAQHRAGLAGLVMFTCWLERQPGKRGLFRIAHLDDGRATLELDEEGLKFAFDELYSAANEEQPRDAPLKNKQKEIVTYLRTEEKEVVDKKGAVTKKTVYIYEQVVPRGGFLLELDAGSSGSHGPWIKLWRDFIWSVMRGVPATREPFDARAEKREAKDAPLAWKQLIDAETPVELPSTYFIGAQANTAENVGFLDRGRFQVLLHFWPLAATLYVPRVVDPQDGKSTFLGFAVVIPDVARLQTFCDELPIVLRGRTTKMAGYRPAGSIVDLAAEGALDLAARLKKRLAVREGEQATHDLVHGIDVVHMNKEGNNVRVLSTSRFDPERTVVDEYERVAPLLWDPFFRQGWLINLLASRPWYKRFDRLLTTLPHKKQGFGANSFRHDARQLLEMARETMTEKENVSGDSLEASIFKFVQTYVLRRTKEKYGLSWSEVEGTPRERDYRDAKEKIARDAFLAVRSRTGAAFLDYFASTLGSAPQHLGQERFVAFSRALRADPDDARTLTLLALSAVA